MSEYEQDTDMEVDDQSEDGEIKKSPVKKSPVLAKEKEMEENSISLSSDEADTADSLDIKPPQAAIHHKDRMHKRDKQERDRRSHKESHRKSHHRAREHRDRREERHREKRHHRERQDARASKRGEREPIREHEKGKERIIVEDLRERLDRDKHERRMPERMKVMIKREETIREKAERIEKEKRRERLLVAGSGMTYSLQNQMDGYREIMRQKESFRRELEARRQRRYLEQEKERTLREIEKKRERSRSRERKKRKDGDEMMKSDSDKEQGENKGSPTQSKTTVFTVSDDDDDDDDENNANEVEASGEKQKDEEMVSEDNVSEEHSESEEEESSEETETSTDSEAATESDYSPGKPPLLKEEVYKQSPESPERVPKIEKSPSPVEEPPPPKKRKDSEEELPFVNESPKSDIVLRDELPPYLPAIQGCRSVEEFQCLNRIEEGTYGVVYRARDKRTEEIVALKRLKMEKEKEGFPITSLREINTLLKAQHINIVTVREIVVGSNMDKIFIVMDYVEHDLKSLMETMKQKKQVFIPGEVKCLMQQLLRAVAHLHDNWILHRDLKTSNLLLSHKGILKVGDFGLAREYGSPLKPYTPIVVTLWYRSPELLLGAKEYSTPVDLWSVGCIFGEFLSMEPLFPGKSEVDQLNRIFKDLGTPNEQIWPGYSKLPAIQKMTFTEYPVSQLRTRFGAMLTDVGVLLMNKFLTYDPVQRVTAEKALEHEYFGEAPLPIDPAMFPTWPAKSELGHRKVIASPKPPSGGREYKQLGDTDDDVSVLGFHMGVVEKGRSAVGAGFSLKF